MGMMTEPSPRKRPIYRPHLSALALSVTLLTGCLRPLQGPDADLLTSFLRTAPAPGTAASFVPPSGQLDTSFGGTGATTYNGGAYDACSDLALLSDGSIAAAGTSYNGVGYELVAFHFSSVGTPDLSFGASGVFRYAPAGQNAGANKVLALAGDSILIAGGTWTAASDSLLLKIDSHGNTDSSFASAGIGVFPLLPGDDSAVALALDTGGRPVVALQTGDVSFMAARFTPSGALDASFNAAGYTQTLLPSGQSNANAGTVDATDRVIAVGYDLGLLGTTSSTIIRYTSAGTLDTAFGGTGIVQTEVNPTLPENLYSVVVQPDGRILAAGWATSASGDGEFTLLRFLADGTPDASFGASGIVRLNPTPGDDSLASVILQPDGKIIAGGTVDSSGANPNMAVVRLNVDGSLDTGFGAGGMTMLDVYGHGDYLQRVLLQPDGRILVGGVANNGTDQDLAILRLK